MSLDVVSTWLFLLLYEPFSALAALALCFGVAVTLYSVISDLKNKSDQKGGDA